MSTPGKITISRRSSNVSDEQATPICITIDDGISGVQIVEVHLRLSDFAEALTGVAMTPCRIETGALDLVGKAYELKDEVIFVATKGYGSDREKAADAAIKPYEKAGWRGSRRDAVNHHNISKHEDKGYHVRVGFHRYVDASPEAVAEAERRHAERVGITGRGA